MTVQSEADVAALRRIGMIVSRVLQQMLETEEHGMTTRELDALGDQWLQGQGAR